MSRSRKPPFKRFARLLARYQRERTVATAHFSKSGAALDQAISLGIPLETPIDMPDGTKLVVCDQFAERNVAFKAASVPRYVVKPYRADKSKLPVRPAQAASIHQPEEEPLP